MWVTTAAGLDWPKSTSIAEQQSSLRRIIADMKTAHFNTIFFQARARGDAYYKSAYEPWAENLTGTIGRDPGWDPLAFLLREAHAAGMEVHAWFNMYKIRGPNPVGQSSPQHLSLAHPEWTASSENEIWLDPGIPEVRMHLLRIALDLIRTYDVDGIQFDFIRYPGKNFPDNETFRRYGNGMNREDWRRSNIDRFVSEFYDSAMSIKPMLKVGSAPMGVYDGANKAGSFYSCYQDSQGWLQRKKHDYLVPQIYWSIGGNPDFAALIRDWQRTSNGRHVYAGIAAYKPEVEREIQAQIDSARAARALGQAYFRYENIRTFSAFGRKYSTLANIPPMPWKDDVPPLPPQQLAVHELAPSIFHLEWKAPSKAGDGDQARYYNIYRSTVREIDTDNPYNLVAITTTNDNFYVDTVRTPSGVRYYYAVTAFDKGNNESAPSRTETVTVREALAIGTLFQNGLSTSIPKRDSEPTLIAYRLARRTDISLEIVDVGAGGNETVALRIASGVQNEGTYVVGVGGKQLRAGNYTVRLRVADLIMEQALQIR